MSELEKSLKPFLLPMILGQMVTIDREKMDLLSLWATKTVMTAEFIDPESVGVSAEQRTFLFEHRRVPDQWYLWLADHQSAIREAAVFHAAAFSGPESEQNPIGPKIRNTQETIFTVGRLCILAISTWAADTTLELEDNSLDRAMTRLWPPILDQIQWPVGNIVNEQDVADLARLLDHMQIARIVR